MTGEMQMKRTASCQCGQLQIEVEGEPAAVGLCHCLACQKRTGSAFAALAGFRGPYRASGNATVYLRTGDQGAQFRFRFCPVCGTNLFHTEEGVDGSVSIAIGAFDDCSLPPPKFSVYDSRRHAWVVLPPDVIAFCKDPE
jgi:hypothetical protein